MSTKTTRSYVQRALKTFQDGTLLTNVTERRELVRTRTGVELPGWQEKIKSKEVNATTPLDASEGTMQAYSPGSFSVRTPQNNVFRFEGLRDLYFDVPKISTSENTKLATLSSQAEAIAIGNAYNKIQGVMNPFGASVFLGELKETIGFLRNPLEQSKRFAETFSGAFLTYRKQLEHLKARGLDGPKFTKASVALAKQYANSLLELRFGILPLVHDSIAILELAKNLAERNSVLTFRTYGTKEDSVTTSSNTNLQYYQSCTEEITTSLKAECVIRFGIKEHVDGDGGVYDYTKRSLLELANVPAVMWELTYLSWMVDYFVNVNDILTAVTTSTKSVVWQAKSVIRTKTVRCTLHSFVGRYGGEIIQSANQVTTFQTRSVKRTVDALAIPSVTFRVPGYTQIQNVAAFLVQKL